jgi:hypothetical protein
MVRLRSRPWRMSDRLRFDPSPFIVLVLAMLVAGCGNRAGHAPTAEVRVVAPPHPHFRTAVTAPPVEMEADGLPDQRAPLIRRTHMPDDPSEPFSPNYGNPQAAVGIGNSVQVKLDPHEDVKPQDVVSMRSDLPVVRVSVRDLPEDLPPDFRERLIVSNSLR